MKSMTKKLLLVAVGVVVLGGAAAALLLTAPEEEDESSSSSTADNTISLVSKQEEDIVSMKITNEQGSFTLIPHTEEVETSSTASDGTTSTSTATKTTYLVEELGEDIPINVYATDRVVEYGFSLNASKNLGEMDDLSEYGLDQPKASIEVKFKDGTTYDYDIGNPSGGDGSGYYMCSNGSNNVYIVTIDDGIFDSSYEFVDKELAVVATDASSVSSGDGITNIELSGSNYPTPITITLDDGYSMYAGREMSVDEQAYSALSSALSAITADGVAYVHPTAEELKACGLDNPAAVVEFTGNEETFKISAGNLTANKQYYVMLDGRDVIYLLDQSSASPWVENSIYNLRSKFVALPMITDVDTLTVSFDGTDNIFHLTRTKNEEQSTEDKIVYDYEVTGNGTPLTYDNNFKKYYQTIIAVQLLEYTDQKPEGEPEVVLTYHYYDDLNKADDIVKFYRDGDRRYVVELNGVVEGLVNVNDVEYFKENTYKMLKDETIVTR